MLPTPLAAQVAWTVWFLCNHPEAEARLVAELQAVQAQAAAAGVGAPAGGAPTFSWQQLQQCPFLGAVLKESLRVRPPVGLVARRAPSGATLGGYDMSGKVVLVSPYVLHRSAEWGPDAEQWRPERWLEGGTANAVVAAQPYFYLPFSRGPRRAGAACVLALLGAGHGSRSWSRAGACLRAACCPRLHNFLPFCPPRRNCIGEKFALLEAKTILAMLYSAFTFEYAGDRPEQARRSGAARAAKLCGMRCALLLSSCDEPLGLILHGSLSVAGDDERNRAPQAGRAAARAAAGGHRCGGGSGSSSSGWMREANVV